MNTNTLNLHIIPYESEETYKANVDKILTALLSNPNIKPDNIMLTEGEYSYIFNSHDAYLYASKYNIQHRDHSTLSGMLPSVDVGGLRSGAESNVKEQGER